MLDAADVLIHRQLVFRHRYVAAAFAVEDRDRAAPVALAADAPVAQTELGLACAVRTGFQLSLIHI